MPVFWWQGEYWHGFQTRKTVWQLERVFLLLLLHCPERVSMQDHGCASPESIVQTGMIYPASLYRMTNCASDIVCLIHTVLKKPFHCRANDAAD